MKQITVFFTAFLCLAMASTISAQQLESAENAPPPPGRILTINEPLPASSSAEITSESVSPNKNTAVDSTFAHETHVKQIWLGSIALMLAGTTADAATSWHKQEANSFLASSNGTFGAKAIGIKVGLTGALLLPQVILRHHPELWKAFIIGNLVDAGVFGVTAIHNSGVRTR